MSIGLDTSVVLRLLTGAPAKQAEAARALLAASRDSVCISDLVVGESYFVLRHHYAVLLIDATQALAALLDDPRVQCTGVSRRAPCLALWINSFWPIIAPTDARSSRSTAIWPSPMAHSCSASWRKREWQATRRSPASC